MVGEDDNGLRFDYATWVKQVDAEAGKINRDPHAYMRAKTREAMRDDLPRFLRFLIR